jgi:hypothetical protein
MGATSSINMDIKYDIYVSYVEETPYIDTVINNLRLLDYKIIDSSVIKNSLFKLHNTEISNYLKKLLENSIYIFICLSSKSFQSYSQTMEINELITNTNIRNSSKIIYLFTDENFTLDTNPELKEITKQNKWFLLYDDETTSQTCGEILTILMNCNE